MTAALFSAGLTVSSTTLAACLNNTIEFRNDQRDGTYFHVQKIRTTIQPQPKFLLAADNKWTSDAVPQTQGSQLKPFYTPAWSIEVHYDDAGIDAIGAWKTSALTGNEYAVVRGKHVPADVTIEYPRTYRDQGNTHLSKSLRDRASEWDTLDQYIDNILTDANGSSVVGYGRLSRSSPTRDVIGKLAKWIKNKRLSVLMNGGGNVDGAIHPVDFINQPPSYCQGASSTLAVMAAQLGVPARLGETRDHSWVEVFVDGNWQFVENQPETFLDVVDPPIPVWTYPKNGREHRGYQPKSAGGIETALQREALIPASLIDIVADPAAFGLVDGSNRYSWFFDWSNPFVYDEQGEISHGVSAMAMRPEVYADSVFNYYSCSYNGEHNSSQCGQAGRQFQVAEWYASQWELAALYPGRQSDLPYVFSRNQGNDTHIMYLTPIRGNSASNSYLEQSRVNAGRGVRQQFYLSEKDHIKAVYGVLYLGPDGNVDHTIPKDGGDWYFSVNDDDVYLRHLNGLSPGDGESDGVETNYLGLGQTVLRVELDLNSLVASDNECIN